MDKIIARLVSQIEPIGGLEYNITEDSITVKKKTDQGFVVILTRYPDQSFVVNYGHYWHGHFDILEEAENFFISGVTGRARLVCTYHWRYLTKAIAEIKSEGQWQQVDEVGSCLGFLVWWLPKRVVYFSNILVHGILDPAAE